MNSSHEPNRAQSDSNEMNKRQKRSVVVIVLLALLSFSLLLYSYLLTRRVNRQSNVMSELSAKFGVDEGKSNLPYDFVGLKQVDFDLEALQEDTIFKQFVDGFSKYFFGETKNSMYNLNLWLRNDLNDDLVCIYASAKNAKEQVYRGDSSIIGGVACHAPMFVLWPGYNNDNRIWKESSKNAMAWSLQDDEFRVSELLQDNLGKNRGVRLQRNNGEQPFTLNWVQGRTSSSKERALYGFSYDGRLAVELNFEVAELKQKLLRVYVQNQHFRNNVRKFTACINSYLNYYDAERLKQAELLSAERQRVIDSIKGAK